MNERWETLKQNKNMEVSDAGRLRNRRTGVVWKLRITRNGYVVIPIYHKKIKKAKNLKIHTLVAEAFVRNPDNKPQINHKDFNKQNNHYTNLEWCTNLENVRHFYRNKFVGKISDDDVLFIRKNIEEVGMMKLAEKFKVNSGYILGIVNGQYKGYIHQEFIRRKKYSYPKPIIQFDKSGAKISEYTSASQCAKKNKWLCPRIREVLLGEKPSYKGFVFKYKNQEDLIKVKPKLKPPKADRVVQYDLSGKELSRYKTSVQAANETGASRTCIRDTMRGKQKTTHGFIFRYAPLHKSKI